MYSVSCPDATLSRGKGSGDHWAISWLAESAVLILNNPMKWRVMQPCALPTDLFVVSCPDPTLEASPLLCYSSHMTNGIFLTRHNQKDAQWSPDPFPRERVGLGTRLVLSEMWFTYFISSPLFHLPQRSRTFGGITTRLNRQIIFLL